MNSIDAVLQAFKDGDISQEEALEQIHQLTHATVSHSVSVTDEDLARWAEERDDEVRNGFIKAMLHNVPATASSDVVSVFVWDVAQRLMDLRARKVGITKPGDPQLEPPELAPNVPGQEPPEQATDGGPNPAYKPTQQAPADPKTEDNQHPGEPVHDDGPY